MAFKGDSEVDKKESQKSLKDSTSIHGRWRGVGKEARRIWNKKNIVQSHPMTNLENPFEPTTKNRNKRVPNRFFAINVLREEHTVKNIEGRNFVT